MFTILKTSLQKVAAILTNNNTAENISKAPSKKVTIRNSLNTINAITLAGNQITFMQVVSNNLHMVILRLKSTLVMATTAILALVLVACAPGSSSSDPAPAAASSVTAFSHNGYTFAPNIEGSAPIDADGRSIGRVFANPAEISRLVAAQLDDTDAQDVTDAIYNVGFSIDNDDVSSIVNNFFRVDNLDGEDSADIFVRNRAGAGLTFDAIRSLLKDNTISIRITISSSADPVAFKPITRSVDVVVLNADDRVLINDLLSYDRADVSTAARTEVVVTEAEGRVFMANLSGTIATGTSAGDFSFTSFWQDGFSSETPSPAASEGRFVGTGNVFATADLYNAAGELTRALTFNVDVMHANGTDLSAGNAISFASGTALTAINGAVDDADSFLNKVNAAIADFELVVGADTAAQLNFTLTWETSSPYSFTRQFNPVDGEREIQGQTNFAVTGERDENNDISAVLNFANPDNPSAYPRSSSSKPIDAFGISRTNSSSKVTLFYSLRDLSDANAQCADGSVYFDNNDSALKAAARFNHESTASYTCRLAVSLDGITYQHLAFVIDDNATANITDDSTRVTSTTDSVTGVAQVSQDDNATAMCVAASGGGATNCYYGDITIDVTDVNEAPTVSLVAHPAKDAGDLNFASLSEGVGPMSDYSDIAELVSGSELSSGIVIISFNDNGLDVNVSIADDDIIDGDDLGNIGISVAPTGLKHGDIANAFSLRKAAGRNNGADAPTHYQLVVNTTLLDFEAFTAEELKAADGEAIYRLTVTATDNRSDSLTGSATFNFEVKDVQYNPVFVDADGAVIGTDTATNIAGAFIKDAGIINASGGSPLYLLSDILGLQRHRIGTIAAADPETGSSAGITYSMSVAAPAAPSGVTLTPEQQGMATAAAQGLARNLRLVANSDNNARGNRLIVAAPNLVDGISAVVTLTATKGAASSDSAAVTLTVDNSQYENAGLPLGNDRTAASITFNPAAVLFGSITDTANSSVNVQFQTFDPTTGAPAQPSPNIGFAVNDARAIATDSNRVPHYSFLNFASLGDAANTFFPNLISDIATLNVDLNAGLGLFNINSTTGAISIKPGQESKVTFPLVYSLPILVVNASVTASAGLIATGGADLTIATILVTDVNTPPVVTTAPTAVNVNEGVAFASATTPRVPAIVSFTITDDNAPFEAGNLLAATPIFPAVTAVFSDAIQSLLGTSVLPIAGPEDARGNPTVTGFTINVFPLADLDFENAAHKDALDGEELIELTITDGGAYELNLLDQTILATTADDNASLTVSLNITLVDVAEAVVLTAGTATDYAISESAVVPTPVASTSASSNNVVATINAGDFPNAAGTGFNASRVGLSVTGDFKDILTANFSTTTAGEVQLLVADPAALEDLGDGFLFPVTITATADSDASTDTITVNVQIVNDEDNSLIARDVITDALANLAINEQDVAGNAGAYAIPASVFNLARNTLVPDADDVIYGTDIPLVSDLGLTISSVAVDQAGNLQDFVATDDDILTFELEDGVYTLQISDADFVESNLFGDIKFTVTARAGGATDVTIPNNFITVNEAADKAVKYADVNGAATDTPVYALSYTQSGYAAEETNLTAISAGGLVVVNASTEFNFDAGIVGVSEEFINITDEALKNAARRTVQLDGVSGANRFIARDTAEAAANKFSGSNVGLPTGNNRAIIIKIADNDLDLTTADQLDILSINDAGNLVNARAEFERYFTITVDNTTGERNLNLEQKVFEYTVNDNGTPNDATDDTHANYSALDTIQLYAGAAQEEYTLNYFIRAKTADNNANTNASRYALAQFSVEVEAAGLNEPTEITRIALVPTGVTAFPDSGDLVSADRVLNINANQFAVNDFTSYDLLVEFKNPDATTNAEAASKIIVSVAAGSSPDSSTQSNDASDGGLIDLKDPSALGAPSAGVVSVMVAPTLDVNGVAPQEYTRSFAFALAQNLHGSAEIIISVTDIDSDGNALGSPRPQTITINVAELPAAATPVVALSVGGTAVTETFSEDAGPLATAGVDIATEVTPENLAAGGVLGRTIVSHTLAVTNTGSASGHNPRGLQFLQVGTADSQLSYTEHGWGVQTITPSVVIAEVRGFNEISVNRPAVPTTPHTITVVSADDATTYSSGSLNPFASSNYANAAGGYDGGKRSQSKANNRVVIQDDDLRFDTVTNVLGTLSLTTAAGVPSVAGNPMLTNIIATDLTRVTGEANQAMTDLSYTLDLSQTQWNNLRNQDTVSFPLSFTFDAIPVTLANAVNVMFRKETTNAVLGTALTAISITENHDGEITGESNAVAFTDADIDIPSLAANANTVLTEYTFAITDKDGADFLSKGRIVKGTGSGGLAYFNVDDAQLDDAQVGEYTIAWSLIDTAGVGGNPATPLTGTFTLTVTRVDDEPTVNAAAALDFPTPTSLGLNTVGTGSETFLVDFTFRDDDFNEPLIGNTDYSVTYTGVSFSINQPGISSNTICSLSSLSRRNLISGSPTNTLTGNLLEITEGTLNDINFASIKGVGGACADPRIGSTISSVSVSGLEITTGTGSSVNTGSVTTVTDVIPPAYIVQGFRDIKPEWSSVTSLSISPDTTETITLTVTDKDSDDGYPHNTDAGDSANVQRSSPGSAWDKSEISPALSASCTGVSVVANSVTDFVAGSVNDASAEASSTTTFNIRATDSASGTCTLTVTSEGEDGVSPNPRTITVTVQSAPSVASVSHGAIPAVTYGASQQLTVPLSWMVTDNDQADANDITYEYTVTPANVCTIDTSSPVPAATTSTQSRNSAFQVDRSIIINPLDSAACKVSVTATEDGASSSAEEVTILLPELVPSLASPVAVGGNNDFSSEDSYNDNTADAVFTIALTNNDVDADEIDINIVQDVGGQCRAETETTANINNGGDITVNIFAIKPGDCSITVTATENSLTLASVTIPRIVLPELVPVINGIGSIGTVDIISTASVAILDSVIDVTLFTTSYVSPQETAQYNITVEDNNAELDNDGVYPTYAVVSQSTNRCLASVLHQFGARESDEDKEVAVIEITPVSPGSCSVTGTLTEPGGTPSTQEFVFVINELAPTVTDSPVLSTSGAISSATLTEAHGYNPFSYTFDVTDSDNDGESIVVTATSANDAICSVANPTDLTTGSGTATVAITPVGVGNCDVTVTFDEADGDGDGESVDRIIPAIELPGNFKPAVTTDVTNNPATTANDSNVQVVVIATKQDPSSTAAATFPESIASTGSGLSCTARTSDTSANYANPGGIGSIATATYTIEGTNVGICGSFTFTATEDSVTGTADAVTGIEFELDDQRPDLTLTESADLMASTDEAAIFEINIARKTTSGGTPTLTYTTTESDNTDCTITPTTTPSTYTDGTATARYSVTYTGDRGYTASCAVTLGVTDSSVTRDDGAEKTRIETIIFTGINQAPMADIMGSVSDPGTSNTATFQVLVTRQDEFGAGSLTYSGSASGCSVVAANGAAYSGTNTAASGATATLDYTVTYTGGDSARNAADQNCQVTTSISEDGVLVASPPVASVVFPLIPKQLVLAVPTYDPASPAVGDEVTATLVATKQDGSNNQGVTFNEPTRTSSNSGCTINPTTNQGVSFDGNNVDSTVNQVYTVSLTDEDITENTTCTWTITAFAASAGNTNPASTTVSVTFTPVLDLTLNSVGVAATPMAQAHSEITVSGIPSGATVTVTSTDLAGCELSTTAPTTTGVVAADSITLTPSGASIDFYVSQNPLAIGEGNCVVEGDASKSGSLTVDTVGGSARDEVVLNAADINIGTHGVSLDFSLADDESHYFMSQVLCRFTTGSTSINPCTLDAADTVAGKNNILNFLLPKIYTYYRGTRSVGRYTLRRVEGRRSNEGLKLRSSAGLDFSNFRNPRYFPFATDLFFVKVADFAMETDVINKPGGFNVIDSAWGPGNPNAIDLPDAHNFTDSGFPVSLFTSLAARGIDGYLRFTARQTVLFRANEEGDSTTSIDVNRMYSFRTQPDLAGITTSVADNSNIDLDNVELRTEVCWVANLQENVGVGNIETPLVVLQNTDALALSGRNYNFRPEVILGRETSLSCSAATTTKLSDVDASHIVDLAGGVNWRDLGIGGEACSISGGTSLPLVKPSVSTSYCHETLPGNLGDLYPGTVDTGSLSANATTGKLSLRFQHYMKRGDFSVVNNEGQGDVSEMNVPSIYLIEVSPVSKDNPAVLLGKPVKILFQVEPRATSITN